MSCKENVRKNFGPFSNQDCETIFSIVRQIVNEIPGDVLEELSNSRENEFSTSFGSKISFTQVPDKLPNPDNLENFKILTNSVCDSLNLEYVGRENSNSQKTKDKSKEKRLTKQDDCEWLKEMLNENTSDSAPISAMTLNILISPKSDDEIQIEV